MAALDQELVDTAIERALARVAEDGYTGAAALRLSDGSILTNIYFPAPNEITSLCHEAGAICEAYRRGVPVVASVCVARDKPEDPFMILPPCGVCQERLALWGPEVEVAVPSPTDISVWERRRLGDAHAFYWNKPRTRDPNRRL